MQYAGEFIVDTAEIITSENVAIDIRKLLVSLDLYEDMFTPTVTGTLIIRDPVSMQSTAPMIGQEYLRLKIYTPSKTDTELFDFSKDVFSIHQLIRKTDVNGEQLLTLHVVTSEQMKNSRTKIRRVLEGTYDSMVTTLLENDLESKKKLHIEPTSGIKKIIPTNLRPFDLINQFTSQAVSTYKNSPTYFFYETMKGYHFRSLESMYAQKPKFTFKKRGNLNRNDGKEDVLAELNVMQAYDVGGGMDTLSNTMMGTYASNLITHDIFNKKINKHSYNFHDNFKNEVHINHFSEVDDNPIFSPTPINDSGGRISDFAVRTLVAPISRTTSGTDSTKSQTKSGVFNYEDQKPENIMQRISRVSQILEGFSIRLEVKGNTSLNVGDIVQCNLDINTVFDVNIYCK